MVNVQSCKYNFPTVWCAITIKSEKQSLNTFSLRYEASSTKMLLVNVALLCVYRKRKRPKAGNAPDVISENVCVCAYV